jgi:hypothetical protein
MRIHWRTICLPHLLSWTSMLELVWNNGRLNIGNGVLYHLLNSVSCMVAFRSYV